MPCPPFRPARWSRGFVFASTLISLVAVVSQAAVWMPYAVTDSQKIADTFSGHPLDYALLQKGDSLYFAYYDAQQRMTVGRYDLKARKATAKTLPTTVGWDSHNYIDMGMDSRGVLHISGNMHNAALIYFRGDAPYSIEAFTKTSMVGQAENNCTYPAFMKHPDGSLFFTYRDGGSGNGDQVLNRWDAVAGKWSRLHDKIFDGQGQRNAYMDNRATLGPDGYFHVYWMWRETSDAGTTHDVSYIRSKDMVAWENAAGKPVALPITLATPEVRVETIAERSGLINRGGVGFDAFNRPIVSYHRFDAQGNTQMYNARFEKGAWKINQATAWNYRWDIGGTGTLNMDVRFSAVHLLKNGVMTQWYHHVKNGDALWEIDTATLKATKSLGASEFPAVLDKVRQAGMEVHWLPIRSASDSATVYALRWETMPANQDQPRSPVPSPTALMLYTFRDESAVTAMGKPASPGSYRRAMDRAGPGETDALGRRYSLPRGKVRAGISAVSASEPTSGR